MKATGIVRQIDELGRIVLPVELRRTLGIDRKDPIEIYSEGNKIVLVKYTRGCTFCGNSCDLITYKDKLICQKCAEEIGQHVNN